MNKPSFLSSSRPKARILVGVCSCRKAVARRQAVRAAWMRGKTPGVMCRFFVGGEHGSPREGKDMIYLCAPDTYNALPEKVLAFFRYAVDHYEFDWLFKCDDDTFVALDRLEELTNPEFDLIGNMLVNIRNAPSGGAGYFLSRRLVEQILRQPGILMTGAEDLVFGELAFRLGARCVATERLGMKPTPYPMPYNNLVTSHWCGPDYLRAIEAFQWKTPICRYDGEHVSWKDVLSFYDNGLFRREGSGCAGFYTLSSNALTLHWFSWGDESLIPCGDGYRGSRLLLRWKEGDASLPPADSSRNSQLLCIQLGCSSNLLPGWINLDLPHFDITRPLPWTDATVDALFLEHVIEHVSPAHAYRFFEEAWRVLNPGGILRLAFPDVVRIAREVTPEYIRFLQRCGWGDGSPGSALRAIICNHGHKAAWSEETLRPVLESVGFQTEIRAPGESGHPHLQHIESHGFQVGDVINRVETSCIEAQKPL